MINKGELAIKVIGVALFVAIFIGVIAMESSNCDGQLVRGLFWFECIGVKND